MNGPSLSYHKDGLKVIADVPKYPSEEKPAQLKSHHQLYVPLLRNSMQSLYESAKEELSHLKIWVTWNKHCCLLSWITTEPMKRLMLMKLR